MDIDKLNKWADLLLDTGKRNNLINFKDSKMGTVEIIYPNFNSIFSKAEQAVTLEVYDPKMNNEEEIDDIVEYSEPQEEYRFKNISKEEYTEKYVRNLKKNSQILIYNAFTNPIKVLQNIGKKQKNAIEETGVNIVYMAFGFINWTEDENSRYTMRAPILLIPISIENFTVVDPYYIKVIDNDIIVNPTFLYKLKNDYGIELPEYDDEGVEEYLTKVEQYVFKLKWTVTRECKISVFSFLKINMYKDLKDNADEIIKNKNIRLLLGEEDIDSALEYNSEAQIVSDDAFFLNNIIDADLSQSEAIELAHKGTSFVLQGPPGTGKSQTIANIIAECLATDKKVLFVSEKLAALNVVYDKLKKAGLEEFCLELHSHKSNKKDVISELCHTLKTSKSVLSDRAQKEVEAKIQVQKELNEYATELHKLRPVINKTLYQLYEEISACRKAPDVDFVIQEIRSKGEDYINKAEIALNRYVEYISSVGYDYHKNEWYGYVSNDSSFRTITQLKLDLKNIIILCNNIKELNILINEKYKINIKNIYQAYAIKDFFFISKDSKFITPVLLNSSILIEVLQTVKEMNVLAKEVLSNKKTIDDVFDDDIYQLNGQLVHKKLTKQFCGVFSRIFSNEYRNIIKNIKLCKKDGRKAKYQEAVSIMDTLCVYQQKLQEFHSLEEKVNGCLGIAYNGVLTNFDNLIIELERLKNIHITGIDFTSLSRLSNQEFNEKQKDFVVLSDSFESAFSNLEESEKRIANKYDLKECDIRDISLDGLVCKYQKCINSIDKIDNWCEFVKLLNKLSGLELKAFVDFSIKNNIKAEDILLAYKKAFYMQWVDVILHDSPILIALSRIPHDETVKLFKTKDELNFEVNKAKIKAKLSAQRPNLDMVAQGSAIAILLREGEKKRKQKGVRVLLKEIGELVQTLKPCFLMSPLSVSTFLSANMKFDIVIFDEASQIFPQDAIGAIYRAKQLVVVGDSKQMPPSNFFTSSSIQEDAEDEFDDVTDFESILDICSTIFPQKRLKWHYRSRFEQLIAFSNKNFYENDLITFPSAKQDAIGSGVDYFYVNGIFDRKSKTNREEAEKIVDLVFKNIEKYPHRSLGVVAFSISQQNLIDKLISKRRKQDFSKEEFFKSDKAEPFFVKNLETVQGDERDTIIFSIAYGKDSQGRLLLNFGPINRDGGERRLNVAVTRAKYNIQVVSSMHYSDIDLSRTKSVGSRLLREYLDYAENGGIALERSISVNPFEEYDSEFEMEVCEFLIEKGYSVDTQVGCSSYKIDLALKQPDSSDYLLAIECDGASYHSSRIARDRDRLRQEILERMGWKFYRIWSTDWFRNKSVEKERLLNAVKTAIENTNIIAKKETPVSDITFEEVADNVHFEFPKYIMTDDYKTAEKYGYNKIKVICSIIYLEAPLSEEWLLKRISFIFGREKVTNVVRDEFNYIMKNCSNYKVIRKNGFLYVQDKEIPMLRIPSEDSSVIRDIKYISLEELAVGMKEILKQNVTVEKNGLFRLLVQQLGFSRIGDSIFERMEAALLLISKDISINGDMLTLLK